MAEGALIDGRAVAEDVRRRVAADVADLVESGSRPPGLATVLVGDDEASRIYVRRKHEASEAVGIASYNHELAAGTSDSSQSNDGRSDARGSV